MIRSFLLLTSFLCTAKAVSQAPRLTAAHPPRLQPASFAALSAAAVPAATIVVAPAPPLPAEPVFPTAAVPTAPAETRSAEEGAAFDGGPTDLAALEEIAARGMNPDGFGDPDLRGWKGLSRPFFGSRPRGIAALRERINREGLYTVVSYSAPASRKERLQNDILYGGRVVYAGDTVPPGKIIERGVALHLPGKSHPTVAFNAFKAAVNPYLGYGYLHAILSSKLTEYRFAEAVSPGAMPAGRSYEDFARASLLPDHFGPRRLALKEELDRIARQGSITDVEEASLREKLARLADEFLSATERAFPGGAFVKNFGEFLTGDYETQIMSFDHDASAMAGEFVARLRVALKKNGTPGGFADPKLQARFKRAYHNTGAKFLNTLLVSPERLLVQKKERIAKTAAGKNLEVRVEFIDGEPLAALNRYGDEYLGEELDEAMAALGRFFARAPEPFRYLAGAADLAKLEDGRWVIIEFNFGNESGTLEPRIAPLGSNMTRSVLLGRPTPLIARFETAFQKGLPAQKRLLRSLRAKDWGFLSSLDDLPLPDAAEWFRNRHLSRWRENPTRENAERTLGDLRKLFDGLDAKNKNILPGLLKGAEDYIRVKQRSTAP